MRPDELERARRALSLTQAQAGLLLGVHKITVSKWERGVVKPGRQSLSLVEAFVGVADRRPGLGQEMTSLLEQGDVEAARALLWDEAHPRAPQEIDPASEAALVQWADRPGSAEELELLVKRLLAEAGVPVVVSDASESGYDAVVEGCTGDSIVPTGDSVWEVSTQRRIEGKAKSDLEKRSHDPLGFERGDTTFVFVTSRRWRGGRAWADKQEKLGDWKAVQVLDAAILSAWLVRSPATRIWFAGRTGAHVDGLWSVDAFLERTLGFLSTRTGEGQPWAVAVAGREQEVGGFAEWVERASPEPLYVQGLRIREVSIFVAAALRAIAERQSVAAEHLAVVVGSLDAWERIAQVNRSLVLVPDFEADPSILIAASGRHKVVVPLEPSSRPRKGALQLGKLGEIELRSALEATGFSEPRAGKLARTERAGVTVLLQELGAMLPPAWLSDLDPALRTLALVGAFEEGSESDRRVVTALSGLRWNDFISSCRGWARRSDPPLAEAARVWRWTSRAQRWLVLGEPFDVDDRIQAAIDEGFGLKPGQNARAGTEPASVTLREGLAELLARVANPERDAASLDLSGWLQEVVGRLLAAGEQPRLAFSMLVEASPRAFLTCVEDARGDEHEVVWALEKLAWTEDWLPQAVRTLLAMAARVDAEQVEGCAAWRSLRNIFTAWSPQMIVSSEGRYRLLEGLSMRSNNEGQVQARLVASLLLEALPDAQWSQHPTQRPRYLGQEALAQYAPPTRFEIHRLGQRLEQLILERAEHQPCVAGELLCRYHFFRNPEPAIELLKRLAWPEEDRRRLVGRAREALTMGVRAGWDAALVDAARGLVRGLEPADRIESMAWLFTYEARIPGADPKRWREVLEERRDRARDILLEDAGDAVERVRRLLACPGVAPALVGQSLGRGGLDADVEQAISGLGPFTGRELFHVAFFGARMSHLGVDWLAGVIPSLRGKGDVDVLASALLGLPRTARKTWEIVHSLGEDVERAYWRRLGVPYGLEGVRDVEIAASRLLWAGAPWAALELAGMELHDRPDKAPVALAPDMLVRIVESVIDEEREPSGMEESYIERCLEALQGSDLPAFEVETLEWKLLERDWHALPRAAALEHRLGEEPGFVIEVLSLLWLPDEGSESTPMEEPDGTRGRAAYSLLRQWHGIPGRTGRRLDEALLRAWIDELGARAREANRVEAADHLLGEVLARLPAGRDGLWPHEIARGILERSGDGILRDSMMIAKVNARGVFAKSLDEGGRQERTIADGFFQAARRLEPRWPRTAEMLRDLGRHYLGYAEYWDRDAARREG